MNECVVLPDNNWRDRYRDSVTVNLECFSVIVILYVQEPDAWFQQTADGDASCTLWRVAELYWPSYLLSLSHEGVHSCFVFPFPELSLPSPKSGHSQFFFHTTSTQRAADAQFVLLHSCFTLSACLSRLGSNCTTVLLNVLNILFCTWVWGDG